MSFPDLLSPYPPPPDEPQPRWYVRIGWAVRGFVRTRAFRRLLLASPALLVGLALLGLGTALAFPDVLGEPSELRARYEEIAKKAVADGDKATAEVCLDRLTRLEAEMKVPDPEFTLRLSKLARDLNQVERAEALLSDLAPDDKAVYAPAHFERALLLLGNPKGVSREDRIRADRHLEYALRLQHDMIPAHQLLGMLAFQSGEWSRAEMHLKEAVDRKYALSYMIALTLFAQDRKDDARTWAEHSRDHFRQLTESDPDDHEARLLWASSELLLENYAAARTILERGLSRKNLREFHQLLANTYVGEADALQKDVNSDLGARLALLVDGLHHDPDNQLLLDRLSKVLQGNGAEAEKLRATLRGMLADGRSMAGAHLLLGFDAWGRGQADEARLHWEQAHKAVPEAAMVANNLAWALASAPKPDLDRALGLVELALDRLPDEPTFLSTRGRIRNRQKRWKEALADLEAALPGMPSSPDLHADLAEAYDALGQPDLAREHRRRAAELRAPSPAPPTDTSPGRRAN